MNLYLISQTENTYYNTYDSAVVSAESKKQAKLIHPSDGGVDAWLSETGTGGTWATTDKVKVKLIGTTHFKTIKVICASFNAG